MKKQMTATVSTVKPKDPKYIVKPNLSLRGRDIMSRLRNNSLKLTPQDNYGLEEEADSIRRMNRLQLAEEKIKNAKNIESLQNKLNNE